jgi:phospholipid-binding lipoprotein MlaA
MEKHEEDFGQTFGRWGMEDGAYVVWPFFGPRTARDTIGLVFDIVTDPLTYIDHVPTRNTVWAVRVVSNRAELLKADKVIEEAALDKYSYVRDAYLQRRRSLIHDGNPPKFDPYSGSGEGKVSEASGDGAAAEQVAARN